MKIFITGTSGFIGFHLAKLLLEEGFEVHGYDGLTDYYDVNLKLDRTNILKAYDAFTNTQDMLENDKALNESAEKFNPDVIVHLAAQAGVRYSLENPRAYIESNILGTFNVMEIARSLNVKHLLMASTSSVYGANEVMPFNEKERTDTPLTIYAATKKANESMGHSYAHLWNLPVTMFRFFTVYGPWGRPDMALFKFTEAILKNEPIDVYNFGEMYRDFTYVEDLVRAIRLLIDTVPSKDKITEPISDNDSRSAVAPFRVVNIGNSDKIKLTDFIEAIESELGLKARQNLMPMQMGDVPATWANASLLRDLTDYRPDTDYKVGVSKFIKWYRDYYDV